MASPFSRRVEANVNAVAQGDIATTIVGEAPHAGVVTEVTYIANADVTNNATNGRTWELFNRGQAGDGTTLVATIVAATAAAANLVANDEKTIPLTATAADLVVASGDVLEWVSTDVGDGVADPGGKVIVKIRYA